MGNSNTHEVVNKRSTPLIRVLLGFLFCVFLISGWFTFGTDLLSHSSNSIHIALPISVDQDEIESKKIHFLEDFCKQYASKNKSFDIIFDKIPMDKYSNWLYSQILEGSAPDIYTIMPEDFWALVSMNALADISKLNDRKSISSNLLSPWTVDGKLYALPYETDPPCIIINQNLLKGGYITVDPSTFDWLDFFYISKFFTKDIDKDGRNDFFGVTNFNWRIAAYANGSVLFDYKNKSAGFISTRAEYAIKYAIDINRISLDSPSDAFETGHAAMKVTTLSQARFYLQTLPFEDISIIQIPNGPDGQYFAEPYDMPFAINERSRNKDQAYQFLTEFIFDPNVQADLFNKSFGFPVLQNIQKSEQVRISLAPYIDYNIFQTIIDPPLVKVDFYDYYNLINIADKEIFQFIKYELDINNELSVLNQKIVELMRN